MRLLPRTALAPGLLVGLALAATFTNAPGSVIADARYEHLADPIQFLARHASIWDDQRTLGASTQYFSPTLGAAQAIMQLFGAVPWVIERLTHALLLSVAGLGARCLGRSVHMPRGAALGAGIVYAFNPYTTQFLLPSGLFAAYAVAPWLAVAARRGVKRGDDVWRWAAAFAVAVFAIGALNTSSLLLAMVPGAAFMALGLGTRDATLQSIWAWLWRTAVLTAGVSAAMVVVLLGSANTVRFNLATTETPQTTAANSSASESWRGLGQWLSYLRFGGAVIRDQAAPYFTDVVVIFATFAVLAVAAAALRVRPDRLTSLLVTMAALSVVLMVGIHPVGDPSPFGSALETAYETSPFARGFRSMYKAGAGLQLALALLVGIVWQASVAWRRITGLVLVGAVVFTASLPFWTGGLYPTADRHDEVPEYWEDAFTWFEGQPSEPGVSILPSLARTRYRWGYVNDTLFDARLPQRAVSARTLPESTPFLATLTESIDSYLSGRTARPGALAPMLRAAGVRWVLLQNDVDWQVTNQPRPAQYDVVRDDPDFRLVASFGEPGENVTAEIGFGPLRRRELSLAPVEVYELIEGPPSGGAVHSSSLLVSGAPDVWPTLARQGWLDLPVLLEAPIEDQRAEAFAAAEAFVITDGAQRRASRVVSAQSLQSPVLATDQGVGRAVQAFFDDAEDQTVATYGDLASVVASHSGVVFDPWQAEWWPDKATDGDESTGWASSLGGRQELMLRLNDPTPLRSVTLVPFVPGRASPEEAISSIELLLDHQGGAVSMWNITPSEGDTSIAVDRDLAPVVSVRVAVTASGRAGLVGLSEVSLVTADGRALDGRQRLRVPGPSNEAEAQLLQADIGETPVHHLFTRVDEQGVIRREFWRAEGPVVVHATIRLDEDTPETTVEALLGAQEESGAADPEDLATSSTCRPLFELDGLDVAMRPALGQEPDLASLRRGMSFVSCAFLTLETGWHLLDGLPTGINVVESVSISPPTPRAIPEPTRSVMVERRSATNRTISARVLAGDIVVTDVADDPGWRIDTSGVEGERISASGFVAWRATDSGSVTLQLKYGPQRTYRIAWYVTAVFLATTLWLLIPRARSRVGHQVVVVEAPATAIKGSSAEVNRLGAVLIVAGFVGLGWVVGSFYGAMVGLGVAALLIVAPRVIIPAAVLTPFALAIVTLLEAPTADSTVGRFVLDRPVAHDVGLAMVLVWIGAAWRVWSRGRPALSVSGMSYGRRQWRPLALLVLLAIAAVTFGVD